MRKKGIFLLTLMFIANINTTFGKESKDKIIFLTDYYSTFISKFEAEGKESGSLYKENVQSAIFDKYFKRSEYSDIVRDYFAGPVTNTSELSRSIDRIALNKENIKTRVLGSLDKCRQSIAHDSLIIYIIPVNPANRMIIENMAGIMGLTAGSKQIILTIEPEVAGWEDMLEYAVAHEFNHAYWTKMNYGKSAKWTLLDYLVFEGRGDYFAHLLYPEVKAPWTKALSEDQKTALWNKIKPNLQSEDFSYHMEVMFGSMNYPVWGGYSIGYDIVQTALMNKTELKADIWTNFVSDDILKQSKYK